MKKVMGNFDIDYTVALHDVSVSALVAAFSKELDGKIIFNQDMERIRAKSMLLNPLWLLPALPTFSPMWLSHHTL